MWKIYSAPVICKISLIFHEILNVGVTEDDAIFVHPFLLITTKGANRRNISEKVGKIRKFHWVNISMWKVYPTLVICEISPIFHKNFNLGVNEDEAVYVHPFSWFLFRYDGMGISILYILGHYFSASSWIVIYFFPMHWKKKKDEDQWSFVTLGTSFQVCWFMFKYNIRIQCIMNFFALQILKVIAVYKVHSNSFI